MIWNKDMHTIDMVSVWKKIFGFLEREKLFLSTKIAIQK